MNPIQWLVNLSGLALIVWIVWYFWLYEKKGVTAVAAGDVQEVRIRVKGGYDPDVIVVQAGKPVRLHFYREEEASCSEMVIFDDFNKSAHLPPFQETVVELPAPEPGEYGFQCQMGMLRGKLIAK